MSDIDAASTPLQAIANLFECLNEAGIRYCHWKSTYRLPKAIIGRTDLDILVDRQQSRQFKLILYQCDFKPFVSNPSRQFPAIEDYLGFDCATGSFIHLHIHYRLVLGEQYAKNYYLPLEQAFLDNTDMRLGIKVPAPELEIIVLVLRTLLKYRDRDVLADRFGIKRLGGIPAGTLREFSYLLAQTDAERIRQACAAHVRLIRPDLIMAFLSLVQTTPISAKALYELRGQVRRELMPYQRHSRLRAQSTYYQVMLARESPLKRLSHRFKWMAQDKHKIPVSGGLTVAFVGADGAGKSTLIQHITKWLSWRLNVHTYYMGSSRPSAPTKVLKEVSNLAEIPFLASRRILGEKHVLTRLADRPRRLFENLRYLADGRDRYSRYLAGRRKAAQGSIVIFDRYPLQAVRISDRTMDGPRIAAHSNGNLDRFSAGLCQVEERIYRRILPAEHLFVLHVSPEVSQTRKPEHARERIEAKSQAIRQIQRGDSHIIDIDADQPLEQVLLQIKTTLWQLL